MVLTDWDDTRKGLHTGAKIVSAVRLPFMDVDEKLHLHYSLSFQELGLTSGKVEEFGELILDFEHAAIILNPHSGPPITFYLNGQTGEAIFQRVIKHIDYTGHEQPSWAGDDEVININDEQAFEYRMVLWQMQKALETFRSSLTEGVTSPLVLWPHGFDVAFMWFRGDVLDENEPHVAFGFSPYSAGFTKPYLYSYAYPWPEELTTEAPGLMRWSEAEWKGLVVDYDSLLTEDINKSVLDQCQLAYELFF